MTRLRYHIVKIHKGHFWWFGRWKIEGRTWHRNNAKAGTYSKKEAAAFAAECRKKKQFVFVRRVA